MRLYLDTNIIVYFLFNRGELATDVSEMLFDYSNALFASSVCVHEMIHLSQIGKVQMVAKGKRKLVDPQKIIESILDKKVIVVLPKKFEKSVFKNQLLSFF